MSDAAATTPLIVVCLRPADPGIRVDPLDGRIDRDAGALTLPPPEAAALEQALRLASAWSGRVLAISAGDAAADAALRDVMAFGVQVLRVPWPVGGHDTEPASAEAVPQATERVAEAERYVTDLVADERDLAAALAEAVRQAAGPDGPALVLCGDRSADRGTGALPAYLAHELGAAQALGLVRLEDDRGRLIAERRLDGGRRELLRVPRPAVCSVEAAGVRLRRAGLPGILATACADVPVAEAGVRAGGAVAAISTGRPGAPPYPGVAVGRARAYRPRTRVVPPPAGTTPRERLLDLTGALETRRPPALVRPADAAEAAEVLLDYLRRAGHLAADTNARG